MRLVEAVRRLRDAGGAAATVTRFRATTGYNLAYVVLGAGLGVRTARTVPGVPGPTVGLVAVYAAAVLLVKGAASVADAVHDRAVDAANPETDRVAVAVDRLGVETCWSLFAAELVGGLFAAGRVALRVGAAWPLALASVAALSGFGYSYPPRLKERGALNHVVTTGVDVGAVVLPVAVLVAGRLSPVALSTGVVVFAYTFGYHLVHQAADAHYDRAAGVETFATRVGVTRTLALAAGWSALGGGVAAAVDYPLAALAAFTVAGWYGLLSRRTRGRPPKERTDLVAASFDVARVATGLNVATALAVWRHALAPGTRLLPPA